MATKKHSKSTDKARIRASKVRPAKLAIDIEALKSAIRLVRVACNHEVSFSDMDPADRLELVRAAEKFVTEWFQAHEKIDPSGTLYEALGVLGLVEHALTSTVAGELSNGISDPVQSGLDAAERLLLHGIRKPCDHELMARSSRPREAA